MMNELLEQTSESLNPYKNAFIDREMSWMQFNLRVLMEADDERVPLLERLSFLSIYYSNLDEFYMVRAGSLIHRNDQEPNVVDVKTGWNAAQQLKNITAEAARQQALAEDIYKKLIADLAANGIDVLDFKHMNKAEESLAAKIFDEIRYLLSPILIDERHPFPFLPGKQTNAVVLLEDKDQKSHIGLVSHAHTPKFRSFDINGRQKIVIVSELIRHFAPKLFKHYVVKNTCTIRLIRNADMMFDMSEEDADYRRTMETGLKKRGRQSPVRLQIHGKPTPLMIELLKKGLNVSEKRIIISKIPFNISFSGMIKGAPGMKNPEQKAVRSISLKKGEYFKYLENNDILLSYPYQSITPFIEMLYEAADDPEVISIKITLYRLASSSRLAAALAYAAECGKHVECMLELRARFDEQSNIDYSKMLENAGCTIYYGLPEMKVHCKVCLITRKRGDEISFITQIGTGNYNESTSEHYTDLSLISSNKQAGLDAASLFDALSTGQTPVPGERLLIAPDGYKSEVLKMMDRELVKGSRGYIFFKINSLNDIDIMKKMIDCSRHGVKIEMVIRGICCLRPGILGVSDNITIRSIIGRHLEHSRILIFGNGEDRRIFIGSGDMLNRNTVRRVEVYTEVKSEDTIRQILDLKEMLCNDHEKSWIMCADGSYVRDTSVAGSSSQQLSYEYFGKQLIRPEVPAEAEAPAAAPAAEAAVKEAAPAAVQAEVKPEAPAATVKAEAAAPAAETAAEEIAAEPAKAAEAEIPAAAVKEAEPKTAEPKIKVSSAKKPKKLTDRILKAFGLQRIR